MSRCAQSGRTRHATGDTYARYYMVTPLRPIATKLIFKEFIGVFNMLE